MMMRDVLCRPHSLRADAVDNLRSRWLLLGISWLDFGPLVEFWRSSGTEDKTFLKKTIIWALLFILNSLGSVLSGKFVF